MVIVRNLTCSVLNINTGVPQGSVLEPLLFLLHVNGLTNILTSSKMLMYADDTAVIVTAENIKDLQHRTRAELKKIFLSGFRRKKIDT